MLPFTSAITGSAGKWFEIDSEKGQVWLKGAQTEELAFAYHDKGYISLYPSLFFEDGVNVSYASGGNTVTFGAYTATEAILGKYIYAGGEWRKILSVNTGANTASVTGSFAASANNEIAVITDINEITIEGENMTLTKLEIDYTPKVR